MKLNKVMIVVIIIALLLILFFGSIKMTGFVTLNNPTGKSVVYGIFVLIIIVAIFFIMREKSED